MLRNLSAVSRYRFCGEVELRTGVRMPYFEQGEPSGIPLVLVHAVGDSQRIFEGLLDHLPVSIHAFAPTMRGHGDAGRPPTGYRSGDYAADLAAFMDALGIKAAIVAGGSSGGLVAQCFSINYPGRLLGLVLLGSPLTFRNKPSAQALWNTTFSTLTDPLDPDFVRGLLEGLLSRPMPESLVDVAVQESLRVPAFVWRETLRATLEDDFSAELSRVAVPALVIWGDGDALLPREDQETLARLIPGARLVVYPGAGHVFYWEEPARVAADLAAFSGEIAWQSG
jgi:non-heme chloroperoxidase